MARIRTVKPSFFKHGELYDAEIEFGLPLRVAYAGLWTIADREGRFKYKPRDIKVDVLPYDDVNMQQVLEALEAKSFIQTYEANGQKYAYIPAFKQHQHVNKNEAQSTIPEPPKNNSARAKRVRKPSSHLEERKGKEGKGTITETVASAPFDLFWNECPKKIGRGAAEKKFEVVLKTVSAEILIDRMRRYAASRVGQDEKYTCQPATWLNQKRWMDELPPPPEILDEAELLARRDRADRLM